MKNKKVRGFTLIEVLLALLISGLMAAIAIPKFSSIQNSAKEQLSKSIAHTLQTSIETFYLNQGSYPEQTETISQLIDALMTQGYINKEPNNPFTNAPYTSSDPSGAMTYDYNDAEGIYTLTVTGKNNTETILTLTN